jgi:hypothetical protein
MTDRTKPGVAFWSTVVLSAVLVGYPLSFGPACWLFQRDLFSRTALLAAYRPLYSVIKTCSLEMTATRYAELGVPDGWILGWNDGGPFWGTGRNGHVVIISKRPSKEYKR